MIRENLKKEIKMFVEMLHQRAREEGRYTVIVIYLLITWQLTESGHLEENNQSKL